VIVVKKKIPEREFTDLLLRTQKIIASKVSITVTPAMDGNQFETFVFENMLEATKGSSFEGCLEQTGTYAFPDILAGGLYGVEVKKTNEDKWISTGNSVLESSRPDDIETIYIFFGKFGKGLETKFRKYQECLYDVGVTHSPRYKINMELALGDSIFDKMGTTYDAFDPKSIATIQKYYRGLLKPGQELWWLGSSTDAGIEDRVVSPIIQSFKKLGAQEREKFIQEIFAFYPEVFSKSRYKFEKAAVHLIVNYNAVSSSLRDIFTAGGKVKVKLVKKEQRVPKIYWQFFSRATEVKKIIEETPKEKLAYYWKKQSVKNSFEEWKQLVLEYSKSQKVDMKVLLRESFKNGKN